MTDEEARRDIDEAEKKLHEAREEIDQAEKALERAKVEMGGAAQPAPEQPAAPAPEQAPPAEPAPAPAPEAPAPEPAPAAPAEAAPAEPAPEAAAPAPAGGTGKWRVEFLRDECIGAGACVAANADFWEIDEDGKANLKSATYDEARKVWVLEIEDEAQLQKQRDAAGVCPVTVIHIIDPDGNQEI